MMFAPLAPIRISHFIFIFIRKLILFYFLFYFFSNICGDIIDGEGTKVVG